MKDIEFTAALTSEIGNKLFIITDFQDEINNSFQLNDYTISLKHLFFIFQAFPKNDPARKVEEFKRMRRKTKTLELYLVLDYDKIMAGSDEENLKHIKKVFFKGCETFLKPMKSFDWNAFVKIAFPEEQKLVA